MTADEIIMPRIPAGEDDGRSFEARPFSLPELPVSVDIGALRAGRVELGPEVLGTDVVLSLDGSMRLAGGAGETRLSVTRIDGAEGSLSLDGQYANDTRLLRLDLALREGAGGIVASLLDLPGQPAVELAISGSGPIDAFSADVRLATDGAPRLAGTVELTSADADGGTQRGFRANLSGDLAPLFLPDYQDFFGDAQSLAASGARAPDGSLALDRFDLRADALELSGQARLTADGRPAFADLRLNLALPEGRDVVLPVPGGPYRVGTASLDLAFDAAAGPDWNLKGVLNRFSGPGMSMNRLTLDGSGAISQSGDERLRGTVAFLAEGLGFDDAGLSDAVGTRVSGRTEILSRTDIPLRLTGLSVSGDGYGASGEVEVGSDATVKLSLAARADDFSRLSSLAGRPLGGAGTLDLAGTVRPLSGAFDLDLAMAGERLSVGIPELDGLMADGATIHASALRDETGIDLRDLNVKAGVLSMTGSGRFTSGESQGSFDLALSDASVLGPSYGGSIGAKAEVTGFGGDWRARLDGQGQDVMLGVAVIDPLLAGSSHFSLEVERPAEGPTLRSIVLKSPRLSFEGSGALRIDSGTFRADLSVPDLGVTRTGLSGGISATAEIGRDGAATSLRLDAKARGLGIGIAEVDKLIGGDAVLAFSGRHDGRAVSIGGLSLRTAELSLEADGNGRRPGELAVKGRLSDIGLLVPGFQGPLTAGGLIAQERDMVRVDLNAAGPGGIGARVAGTVAPDGSAADLVITGGARTELANAFIAPRNVAGPVKFDLRLNGPARLSSLAGRIYATGVRIVAPALGVAVEGIGFSANISNGAAQIDANGAVRGGGTVTARGTVGLAPPNPADLTVDLAAARLRQPDLYDTRISGRIDIDGPLGGTPRITGNLTLDDTELRIPSTGFGTGSFSGEIVHTAESAAVRETLRRAGLDQSSQRDTASRRARAIPLDVTVSAPARIFVRGRGLDAEFGGSVRIMGTTEEIVPSGAFNLIRGRLDLLGRRFVIGEGTLNLTGSAVPTVRFVASTQADGTTASIVIDGPATEPEIHFESSPPLPEEEVVALMLFGRDFGNLSAFQAAQLASAVATLTGRGGEGIVGKLRQGFGLDDLDIGGEEDGTFALRAGRYLTDNIYSDVSVDSEGVTNLELNLDVPPGLTVRGRFGSDGDTGLGVFFERDY